MENHKELFYMKLLEYEENLPKHYDKDKFVLSGLRYEAILNVYNILCCGGFLSHEHLFHICLFFI
jgi:transketolase N-terminal domain/subunit